MQTYIALSYSKRGQLLTPTVLELTRSTSLFKFNVGCSEVCRTPHTPVLRVGDLGLLCAGLFRLFRTHLFRPLPHGLQRARRNLLLPLFKPLRGLLQVRKKHLLLEHLSRLRDDGLDAIPHTEKFPGRLEKQLIVQQAVVQKRASLLPVT